jgi:hypothetical protein
MTRRVTRCVEHPESCDLVTLAQAASDRRPCRAGRQTKNSSEQKIGMRKLPSFQGVSIVKWTPEWETESSSQSVARTVMIRMNMRDGMGDDRQALNFAP